jgi:RNA polymerase sigma-70 factor (ECF subfamily)
MPLHVWLFDAIVSLAAASFALLAAAALVVGLLREPARRVRVIELTLVGLALLPLLTFVPGYPRWFPGRATEDHGKAAIAETPGGEESAAGVDSENAGQRTDATTESRQVRPAAPEASSVWNPRFLLVIAFGIGSALMVVWSLVGRWAVRRMLSIAVPAGARARVLLREAAGARSDRVQLLECHLVAQPCAFAWWRSAIVLPRGFGIRRSADELQFALAHEWSHIARGDLRSWQLCTLLGWLYFHQPLYWHLRRRLYANQDYLADAAAAERGETAEDYAEFLTSSAWGVVSPALATGLGIGGRDSDLHRRILMLVQRGVPLERKCPRGWNVVAWPLAVMLVAAAACLLPGPLPRAIAQEEKTAAEKPEKKTAPNRLSYGDGTADGKRSIAGTGEMVAFTLPRENAKVAGIRIHGSRYGHPQPPKENVMIYFLNKDLSDTVATKTVPYSRFKRGEPQWVDIRFPKPIEVPQEFWVCVDFRAAQTKGVYVSTDSSSDGSHSRVGLPGGEASEAKIQGDWMIEVLLAK